MASSFDGKGAILALLCATFLARSFALDFDYCSSYLKNVRSTCPSPSTFGGVKLGSYLGRWYEIGSSAQFKIRPFNENGLICITANYSRKTPDPSVISVLNRGLLVTNTPLQDLVQLASSSAYNLIERLGDVCGLSAGFLQTIEYTGKNFSLGIPTLPAALRPKATELFDSVSLLPLRVSKLAGNIDRYVKASQIKVGRISQGGGASTRRLVNSVVKQTKRIDTALTYMSRTVTKVDSLALEYQSLVKTIAPGIYKDTVDLIGGLRNFTGPLGQFRTSIGALSGLNAVIRTQISNTSRNLAPTKIPIGVTLVATQPDTREAGKLTVGFPGAPPSAYWIVELEGSAEANYEVSLVWSCSNFSSPTTLRSAGDIAGQQVVFLLSRTPTVPAKVVERLLSNAEKKGIYFTSDNPFIYTIQSQKRCSSYINSIY